MYVATPLICQITFSSPPKSDYCLLYRNRPPKARDICLVTPLFDRKRGGNCTDAFDYIPFNGILYKELLKVNKFFGN